MTGHSTEQISSSRGVELALHYFGGDGPPLMVCHATGFHAHCYQPMMALLTKHFEVWGVDFRGHGGSTAPADGDFAWSGFASDVLSAIDHIGVSSVRAFGHSMGGTAALLAEKERPGVIESAWVYEPIIFPIDFSNRNSMMAQGALNRRREFDSKAEALHRYASRAPLGMLRADALASYVDGGFVDTPSGTVTLACAPESEAATFSSASTNVADIKGLEVQAVVACGGSDGEPGPALFAGPTADALPNAQLKPYDGLGHFGPLQDPDRIGADIVKFFTTP